MIKIRRGVAHCQTSDCSELEKLVPLLPFTLEFSCPRCGRPAAIDAEFGTGLGSSRHYNEVRVYFGFDAATRSYTELAFAQDESLVGKHGSYAFFSPFVREHAEAELIAGMLLARLNGERYAWSLRGHSTRRQLQQEGWQVAR